MKHTPLFLLVVMVLASSCQRDLQNECAPGNGITPICGFLAPEDLEVIPGGKAILVGGFSLDNENGDIRVLYLADHSVVKLYPPDSAAAADPNQPAWGDPSCPGAPEGFAAHGIHLSRNEGGSYTLLVVNHTSREAIEWFEVTADGGAYAAAWRGCVIIDEELWVNDVAMIPEGGFVASHMMPRAIAGTIFDREPNDREATGYLVEWHPKSGWQKLEGTDGAVPNGVQVSADGKVVYSNQYLADQTVAFERATGKRIWTAPVTGAPDNLSITPEGKLLIATHRVSLRSIRDDCMLKPGPYCGLGFAIHYIDPANGTVTPVFESEGAPFGGATVAVETGGSIYMGAVAGNRIGRIPAPE